ncbi:MAG: branched-chain amino acid transport system II carrier protein [Lachnospiraceae bacterium]|nr:branched-chain amino acid transport system II carrier protein [Lachnospiraceae bacterium]
MTNKRLSVKQYILIAGTLFGMFFGAGNLIFPVHLGQLAGSNMLPAVVGYIATAVGIPILGVAAIGSTHSDGLQALASKVGRRYSYIFTALLYLTIGPFFAIPRCATVSFTIGFAPLLNDRVSESKALFMFSLLFFALVLFFSLKPGNITLWIGKFINPIFLLFLAILLVTALLGSDASIAAIEPDISYQNHAFFHAFAEGYGTMDAIAGLAFGIIVIDIIRGMGITDDNIIAKDVLRSGILTGILMSLIYVLTILMGVRSRALFDISENGGIALTQISSHFLGTYGNIILALTILFACLKTSIGLVTSCSEAFHRMFPKRLSYRAWAIGFTAFSFAISNVGLSAIIRYAIPVLMLIYPPCITLIILALCGKPFHHNKMVYIIVTIFTWAASLFDFFKTLPAEIQLLFHLDQAVEMAEKVLPLFNLNLGWLLPSCIGLIIGLILRRQIPQK